MSSAVYKISTSLAYAGDEVMTKVKRGLRKAFLTMIDARQRQANNYLLSMGYTPLELANKERS